MINQIQSIRNIIEQKKGKRDHLQDIISSVKKEIEMNEEAFINYEKALEIVKQVSLITQKQLEYHLSEQVSLAMEAVFDDPYELKVNFIEKRGKTEVELLFDRNGMQFPPIGSAGGGAIDVAAVALRIAYWSMRQDKKIRSLLILDEPFSQLKGEEANRRALAILQELSQKLELQIIMVSDERVSREDIIKYSDKVFQVRQNKKGVSKLEIL